jgi:hypothetical protein
VTPHPGQGSCPRGWVGAELQLDILSVLPGGPTLSLPVIAGIVGGGQLVHSPGPLPDPKGWALALLCQVSAHAIVCGNNLREVSAKVGGRGSLHRLAP